MYIDVNIFKFPRATNISIGHYQSGIDALRLILKLHFRDVSSEHTKHILFII